MGVTAFWTRLTETINKNCASATLGYHTSATLSKVTERSRGLTQKRLFFAQKGLKPSILRVLLPNQILCNILNARTKGCSDTLS